MKKSDINHYLLSFLFANYFFSMNNRDEHKNKGEIFIYDEVFKM